MAIAKVAIKTKQGYLSFESLEKQPVPIQDKLVAWYKGIGDWNIGFIENNKIYVNCPVDGVEYSVLYATDEEEPKTKLEKMVNGQLIAVRDMGGGCTLFTYCPNVSVDNDKVIIRAGERDNGWGFEKLEGDAKCGYKIVE